MRERVVGIAAALVVAFSATGCAVGFRSQLGGASTPPGVSSGTSNSIVFWDRGGLLSRLGIGGLGVLAMAGAARSQSTIVEETSTYVVIEQTTWVDPEAAAVAQEILDAAVSDDPPGFESSLEIASSKLGGDTSGYMYHLGYESEPMPVAPHLVMRIYGGIGFGRFTFDERELVGSPGKDFPIARYTYFGTPIQVSFLHSRYLQTYFRADLNWVTAANWSTGELGSPSPWHVGAKLKIGPVYIKGGLAWSRMREGNTGLELEAGLAF